MRDFPRCHRPLSKWRSSVLPAALALALGFLAALMASGAFAQAPTGEVPAASSSPAAPPAASAPPAAPDTAAQIPAPSGASAAPPIIAAASLPRDLSPWGMFMNADIVVKVIMIGLLFASLVTWTVWLAKSIEIWSAKRRVRRAMQVLQAARSLAEADQRLGDGDDAVARLVRIASTEVRLSENASGEGLKERISWLLERLEVAAGRRIGRGMGVLASIGATAPFVGLLGTVWGIMNSFIGISTAHTTNLAVVAPGIAEALLATALGLFAAIPAVVIYNVFARSIGGYRALLADAGALVMRLVSRDSERVPISLPRAAE
jgi:biopolymer transport protein ExbB